MSILTEIERIKKAKENIINTLKANDIQIEETATIDEVDIVMNDVPILDTSDATATAGEILKDKTAYVNGLKIVGTFVPEKPLTVSIDEPVGENRTKFWVQKCKNLCDMAYFDEAGWVGGAGMTSTRSGEDIKITSYYKNLWTAIRFRLIDLSDYAGKNITVSLQIKEATAPDAGFALGVCDANIDNRQVIANFILVTKNDGRVSLTGQVPEVITDTNRYLFIQLNGTGSKTPTVYNSYTTYTKIQIEIGDVATEYETYYSQELYILNTDDEYVTFDEDTQF